MRREDPTLAAQGEHGIDGAVLSPGLLVLRFFAPDHADRLLIVNLGAALDANPAPEPLLAPPDSMRWEVRWSSEDPRYGGAGMPPLDTDEIWQVTGECAVLLAPRPRSRS
jgi:maltooligosyltrehalose trehalohydrolase